MRQRVRVRACALAVSVVWGCGDAGVAGSDTFSVEPEPEAENTAPAGSDESPELPAEVNQDVDAVQAPAGDAEAAVYPVSLIIHEDAELSIGALGPFAYPGGMMTGTLTDHGDGTATIFLPASSTTVPPLDIFGIGEVQIEPKDMEGTVDFCTGIAEVPFDAVFRPVLVGLEQGVMEVITDLTTETSQGKNDPSQSLMGERLDAQDQLRLVGIADVPVSDSATVNLVLGLPADARTNMPGHLEMPEGRPSCPSAP